jgi:hypothetical protein
MRILPFTLAGLVVLLAAYAAFRLLLGDAHGRARRIEALFRKPEKPPRLPGPGHYYKRYWS